MRGTLIPVVGPSGAGKDTLIDAARVARPDIFFPTRIITRPSGAVGEVFRGVETGFFHSMVDKGGFAFHWQAHGLFYGIPIEIIAALDAGQDVIFNGSRGMIDQVRQRFEIVQVMVVTAPDAVLARRLAARGREDADDIAARLKCSSYAVPEGADVCVIQNDGPLKESCARFVDALPPRRSMGSV
ncbi:phosphonate metabolism protein/1,5-bisphosphokinase (PRPP-forming) PhnN [Rhodobacterales bacterium 52_120_T64]|nr:phosphonate metabolism protein/1,5-bisphosphokinase (PRPP-forming) PhnN [Rhodobacterales bacterium 52_120_T64]